jgi:simple sugar transport system permease protein
LVIFATWDPLRAVVGALLFGGVNAVQFRLQASGTTIPAAFLNMLPYTFTIIVLVLITWWEAFRKRVGAPAALGQPYMREERA